jgi:hypothetical protein
MNYGITLVNGFLFVIGGILAAAVMKLFHLGLCG